MEFKDGSVEWVPLKGLKKSNLIYLAQYVIENHIQEEPALNWWVGHVLGQRDQIISKVKAQYLRRNHKFRIRIPKTSMEAL